MLQDRLNSFCIMSIESDLLRKISYSEIINEFAERKIVLVSESNQKDYQIINSIIITLFMINNL